MSYAHKLESLLWWQPMLTCNIFGVMWGNYVHLSQDTLNQNGWTMLFVCLVKASSQWCLYVSLHSYIVWNHTSTCKPLVGNRKREYKKLCFGRKGCYGFICVCTYNVLPIWANNLSPNIVSWNMQDDMRKLHSKKFLFPWASSCIITCLHSNVQISRYKRLSK